MSSKRKRYLAVLSDSIEMNGLPSEDSIVVTNNDEAVEDADCKDKEESNQLVIEPHDLMDFIQQKKKEKRKEKSFKKHNKLK